MLLPRFMTSKPLSRSLLGLAALLLLSVRAGAQQEHHEAAVHFEEGMRLIERHAYAQAVPEFEAAYRLSPHPTALYNLGQAYVALNRPSRAIAAFRRLLEEHGSGIGDAQRRTVTDLIREQRLRLGKVLVSVEPADAQLSLDGELVSRQAAIDGLELDPGAHVVEASMPGRETRRLQVQVVAGKTQSLSVYMSSEPHAARQGSLLQLDCELPDVVVELDGADVGHTPLATPLMVDARPHRLRLSRAGYSGQDVVIEVAAREQRRVRCDLRPLADAKARGRLAVYLDQPDAQIWLDGSPIGSGEVPAGRHQLRVEHWGFEPWDRIVNVTAGGKQVVRVELEPKRGYALVHQRLNRERRVWSYVLGAAGVVAAGTSVGLFIHNGNRTEQWRTTQAALDERWAERQPDAKLQSDQTRNDELSDSVQLVDKVTVGLATAGGLLLVGGVGLYFSSDDPSRYSRVLVGSAHAPAGLTWSTNW
jgi:hypothetical protein